MGKDCILFFKGTFHFIYFFIYGIKYNMAELLSTCIRISVTIFLVRYKTRVQNNTKLNFFPPHFCKNILF